MKPTERKIRAEIIRNALTTIANLAHERIIQKENAYEVLSKLRIVLDELEFYELSEVCPICKGEMIIDTQADGATPCPSCTYMYDEGEVWE